MRFAGKIYLLIVVLAIMGCNRNPKAKLTILALNEDGQPVASMPVSITFYAGTQRAGMTDANGLFALEGNASSGETWYGLHQEGYYESRGGYQFAMPKNGKWQPWNPVITSVVRRIINPIPMYVRMVDANLPVTNGASSFDLVVGDWLAPFGKGSRADIVFSVTKRRVTAWKNFEGSLTISFPNAKDGILERDEKAVGGSVFGWLYNAPVDGYEKQKKVILGYVPGKGYFETNNTGMSYIRVRTETNEVGKIVQACYGKIGGPIKFDVRDTPTGWVKFTYYLNPTPNDRNMEFDPKRNLFKNLKSLEEVNVP